MAQRTQLAHWGSPEASNAWAKMIAKAWADPKFKSRLTADPAGTFEEHGVQVPDNVDLKVIEGYRPQHTLWLPPKPEGVAETDLSAHAKNVSDITRQCEQITYATAPITYAAAPITYGGEITRHCSAITRQCDVDTAPGGSGKKKPG